MARPRNEALYNTIKQEAYRQLLTNGYADTTYQSIATACGVTRTAVQNYFFSKTDLALSFFSDLLDALDTVIRKKQIHQENEFDFMFCIGQSFFSFLLKDENRRKLLLDLTASREITGEVLAFEYKWGVQFLAAEQTVPDQKFFDDVFVSMGGFYELLYRYLKDNKPFDLSTHLGRVIRTIMHDHGYSYDDAKSFVAAHHMTEDELETITSAVFSLMEL